jgi:hypothetical protein
MTAAAVTWQQARLLPSTGPAPERNVGAGLFRAHFSGPGIPMGA